MIEGSPTYSRTHDSTSTPYSVTNHGMDFGTQVSI